ncbi:MAG: hypothetical protein M1837_003103 [Sclerophora amabilis]|nr:MAG: hypothetical protein M1837_003103 [Sclerophora amabilis]
MNDSRIPSSPKRTEETGEDDFPQDRFKKVMDDATKTPLCLVSCGSFSPITFQHLRMFEMAADHAKFNTDFEVVGGYLSPVSGQYKKAGLVSAEHRIRMCQLALERGANWLMVAPWEARQATFQPTAQVLSKFDHEINVVQGGVKTRTGERKQVRIALLAGADLIHTMSDPGVWSYEDLDRILGEYGTFIIERSGIDIDDALASLQQWKANIYVIPQLIPNDVSSTKIRLFIRREMSIHFLIPESVVSYIEDHRLYKDDGAGSASGLPETAKD